VLIAGTHAIELMRRLGNALGGLPYTVVVDRWARSLIAGSARLPERRWRRFSKGCCAKMQPSPAKNPENPLKTAASSEG